MKNRAVYDCITQSLLPVTVFKKNLHLSNSSWIKYTVLSQNILMLFTNSDDPALGSKKYLINHYTLR